MLFAARGLVFQLFTVALAGVETPIKPKRARAADPYHVLAVDV
jgi:hypothetical protein